jgi:Zn-dependent metalloprotease
VRRHASTLAFVLAAGALSAQAPHPSSSAITAARALESTRALQAKTFLRSQLPSLGLGSQDDVEVFSVITNPQGEAVVRFIQTHDGAAVDGGSAVVRLGASLTLTANHLEPNIHLSSLSPKLGPDQALAIAHWDLPAASAYTEQPTVERMVFPTRLIGTVRPKRDPASGQLRPDPLTTVNVGSATAPHVWAYLVTRHVSNAKGEACTLHAVVDGDSGLLLRKWITGRDKDPIASGAVLPPAQDFATMALRRTSSLTLQAKVVSSTMRMAKAAPAPASASVVPALGTANTQYHGVVTIPTSFDANKGGYGLFDPTRGLGSSDYLTKRGMAAGNLVVSDERWRTDWGGPPDYLITPYYIEYTMEHGPFTPWWASSPIDTGDLDNIWGNGNDFRMAESWSDPTPNPFGDDAKSSAGEAMYAITTVYDLLDRVYQRKSYDGNDSSIIAHVNMPYAFSGKAAWEPWDSCITCGMGQSNAWGTVNGNINVKNGAELTSIARELGIAMHQTTIPYTAGGGSNLERSHLERSTGAILAQLADAYTQVGSGDAAHVPEVTLPWTYERTRADGVPSFYMDKPSKDGFSTDAYFDGIWMLGQNYVDAFVYGDGPMNRAWYFMARGASADSSQDSYSPYLAGGMNGMGIDKAGQVFYKALTERYTEATDYYGAREACIAAATDLFGNDSTEVQTVTNAFAAVNVGAAYGQPAPVRVTFQPNLDLEGTPLWPAFQAVMYKVVPAGEWVPMTASVQNATDPSLTWKAAGVPGILTTDGGTTDNQGIFNEAGEYKAPLKGDAYFGIQAWSKQDPKQFAQTVAWSIEMDANGDGDVDALDMADLAMLCYLGTGFKDYFNPHALWGANTSISDPDIAVVSLALNNAFNQ